jgi:hypothetical protein
MVKRLRRQVMRLRSHVTLRAASPQYGREPGAWSLRSHVTLRATSPQYGREPGAWSLRGHVTLRATSPQYGREPGAFLVKVDKTDSCGQHVPSSILSIQSILSIVACGNNNYQWVTGYPLRMLGGRHGQGRVCLLSGGVFLAAGTRTRQGARAGSGQLGAWLLRRSRRCLRTRR